MRHCSILHVTLTFGFVLSVVTGAAGQPQKPAAPAAPQVRGGTTATTPALPTGYVIGAADVLSIVFWRDKELSADVVVRPDGRISLPLLNEVQAAGYTPEQLRMALVEAAGKYMEDPNAAVLVKEIHSRNVFVTGNVGKPGTYPLTTDMNVLQSIALAGGLLEFSDAKNIVVIRTESGREQYHKFNYKDVVKQKHTEQNIVLKPGDTVVVP